MWYALLILLGLCFGVFVIHFVAEMLLKKFWLEQYTQAEAAAKSEEFKKGNISEEYEAVYLHSLRSTLAMLSIPLAAWLFRAEISNQIGMWSKLLVFFASIFVIMAAFVILRGIIKAATEHFPSIGNNVAKIMIGIGVAFMLYIGR